MDEGTFRSSPVGSLVRITGWDSRFQETYDCSAFVPEPLPTNLDLGQETYLAVTHAAVAVARLDQLPSGFLIPGYWHAPRSDRKPSVRRLWKAPTRRSMTSSRRTFSTGISSPRRSRRSITTSRLRNSRSTGSRTSPSRSACWSSCRRWLYGEPELFHDAGRIRTTQVFIGGGRVTDARFVPSPPGDQRRAGVDAWASWLMAEDTIPLVIKMALGHYQFETLHPFNDGNGRLGRLVCVLQLAHRGELRVPVLNLSPWARSQKTPVSGPPAHRQRHR